MLRPLKILGASGVAAPGSGATVTLYDSIENGSALRFKEHIVKLRMSHASVANGLKLYERSAADDPWRVAAEYTVPAATVDVPFVRYRIVTRASYVKIDLENDANVLTEFEGEIIGDMEGA